MKRSPRIYAYPSAQERIYASALLVLVAMVRRESFALLQAAFEHDSAQYKKMLRSDSDSIESAISAIWARLQDGILKTQRIAVDVSQRVSDFNSSSWKKKVARALTGVDLFKNEPWLEPLLREWSSENSKLISSIHQQFLDKASKQASDAVRTGQSGASFRKLLQKEYDLTRARANLIARTEVAKLNGQITQSRNEWLGIDNYIWRTSADERVRRSHTVLEGKVCSWSDPSVYKDSEAEKVWKSRAALGGYIGHPGQDFQCRCDSEAIINLEEILA